MTDILKKIVAAKAEEVAALKKERPLEQLREQAAARPPALPFTESLRGPRPRGSAISGSTAARSTVQGDPVNIIAEVKRRSPSKGVFAWHGDHRRQALAYQEGGAKAISVVTDGPFFGGDLILLQEVKAAVELPVLQKEFLLEPYQVHLARAIGADACLLIAAVLGRDRLEEMLAVTREAGIGTLVEVVDEEELAWASAAGAEVIGVNNRDLKTFTIDPARTERLLANYADNQVCIAESGIHTHQDITRLLLAGVDGFLIGEALMTHPDPAAHLRVLRGLEPDAGSADGSAAGAAGAEAPQETNPAGTREANR